MTFAELMVGDWFTDASGGFVPECIFIKTGINECIPINYPNGVPCDPEIFDDDHIVNFCPRFMVTIDELTKTVEHKPFNFDEYEGEDYKAERIFNNIPLYGIYKGAGQTYYKRISANKVLVIWTPKQETMGKIYDIDNYEIRKGTHFICYNGLFNFPEKKLIYPYDT